MTHWSMRFCWKRTSSPARTVTPPVFPEDYPWSSARSHVLGMPDPVLTTHFLTERITDWATFLRSAEDDPLGQQLHQHASIGRPLGSPAFLEHLERLTGRRLRRGRPGRRVVAMK